MCVAPISRPLRRRADCHRSGEPPAYCAWAWMPKPSIDRPGAAPLAADQVEDSRDLSLAPPSGIHPSPRRAQRFSTAGADAAEPHRHRASRARADARRSDRVELAVEVDDVLGPQPAHQLDLLGLRGRRARSNGTLSASYSTVFQPVPTPRRSRLPERMATSAACLATSTAWRCGRISTVLTQLERRRDAGGEGEERERLVERDVLVVGAAEAAVAAAVGAEHVVVGQQVGEAELLDALQVGPDGARIRADLVVGQHRAVVQVDPHAAERNRVLKLWLRPAAIDSRVQLSDVPRRADS